MDVRILERCEKTEGGCIVWMGAKNTGGYGQIWCDERKKMTHRIMYELAHGPIPIGLTIDHLCRVRSCCNPDHLEAVTQGENVRRGDVMVDPDREFCANGHRWADGNRYMPPDGYIRCRQCNRDHKARLAARRSTQ